MKSEDMSKKFGVTLCPRCGMYFGDTANKLSILKSGMCLACDHVEGQVQDDRRRDEIDV
jgi:hypothetical protein